MPGKHRKMSKNASGHQRNVAPIVCGYGTLDSATRKLLKDNVKKFEHHKLGKRLEALAVILPELESGDKAAIEVVLKAKAVPRCVELIKREPTSKKDHETVKQYETRKDLEHKCRTESARLLFKLTEGSEEQTKVVADEEGAVEALINLLQLHEELADLAVRALGNIISAVPTVRNSVIINNTVSTLIDLITPEKTVSFLRNIACFISKLCHSEKPCPPEETVLLCLGALTKLSIMSDKNSAVAVAACMALGHWCVSSHEMLEITVKEIVKSGLAVKVVELLDSKNAEVLHACFTLLVHFCGFTVSTQPFLDAGLLSGLANLLKSDNPEFVQLAAGVVRNIALRGTSQVTQLVDAQFLPLLMNVVDTGNAIAREHVVFTLFGMAYRDKAHYLHLCEPRVVSTMCDMLRSEDEQVVDTTLTAILETLLRATEPGQVESVTGAIIDCGGLDVIKREMIENHQQNKRFKIASKIILAYFPEPEAEVSP